MSKNNHTANILIRIGRMVSFVAAGFLLIILLSEGISDTPDILLVILAVIALAAYVLSYWSVKYGGILFIFIAVAFGIHTLYYISGSQFLTWAMMGLPHLVSGGLLLFGWRMKKKA